MTAVEIPTGAEQDVTEHRVLTVAPAPLDVRGVLGRACARIAPTWPLDRYVAVNPYVGLVDLPFASAARRLAQAAGARSTAPTAVHLAAHEQGALTDADLALALARAGRTETPAAFLAHVRAATSGTAVVRVPTVAQVAAAHDSTDWRALLVERTGGWAAAYFDDGQATWRSPARELGPYRAWRFEARLDRTPEIHGLRGFRRTIAELPEDPVDAAAAALAGLGVPEVHLEHYLHALLLQLGGWTSYAAHFSFERARDGHEDDTCLEMLVVLLAWELALLRARAAHGLDLAWADAWSRFAATGAHVAHDAGHDELADALVLQDAAEHAARRRFRAAVRAGARPAPSTGRPDVQAVFCIDVRSEVLRRHLEATHPGTDTIGFAGFFGFPLAYVPLGHDRSEPQCPVLLSPAVTVAESAGDAHATADAGTARKVAHHVGRSWKSFKNGAVSCFGFVSPIGLAYLPRLVRDELGRGRPVANPTSEGLPVGLLPKLRPTVEAVVSDAPSITGIEAAARIDLAAGALRGMSLTEGLAPLVALVGHGSTSTNNPFDASLACGACGGHSGDVNARVAASVLNDADVRLGLAARGIHVPDDTWFVPALHDTTTDEVRVLDVDLVPASHAARLAELTAAFARAGAATRAERAPKLGITDGDVHRAIARRAVDWAQVRPEWGLAGCRAFIAAPRSRTSDLDLEGRAFLHSYDWRRDTDFSVLSLIINAPIVVASWINLQYYASTVEDRLFGAGDKTLHNVVGRIGVVEGNGGDLRIGLPRQSVHDGSAPRHEPLRLDVVIEAPIDAINDVLAKSEHPRQLFDNGWIHLAAMGDDGTITHTYAGGLRWEAVG